MKGHSMVTKAFSKSKDKSNLEYFLFGVADDAIYEANIFSNESTIYKTNLVVVNEVRRIRLQLTLLLFCNRSLGGLEARGGDSHMKQTGMLVVSLRGINFGFWSRLGCSAQSANILSCRSFV